MARCPACFRRIRLFDLAKQHSLFTYTCTRCGRVWQITLWTVALSVLLSLIPIAYGVIHWRSDATETASILVEALAVSVIVYFLSLLFFARLEPRRRRRSTDG